MRRNRKHNGEGSPLISGMVGIFMICFGIFWTIGAAGMSPFMAFFGIFWTAIAVAITVKNFRSAKEEPKEPENSESERCEPQQNNAYIPQEIRCPYCGAPVSPSDKKCEYCGSKLQ